MNVLHLFSKFASKYFAVIVIFISMIAFVSPTTFTWIAPHITLLLGIIMFGMGLTLKLSDFGVVLKKPVPVVIGVIAQFVIMPLVAFGIAIALNLPPELAAGLVLVGACPGGTASNVMVYLAKGDVPVSVAMTSISTLLAPILTPFILFILADQWLPVDAGAMFVSIVKVIIIPIALGIILRRLLPNFVDKSVTVLPLISIVAILAIVSAVVGGNKENIATTGLLLFAAVMLHNSVGLALGYITAKLVGLDEAKRRAISIEVGMQNSGLGASLATVHFSPLAALPSALFSVWHNISGPLLVTFWGWIDSKRTKVDMDTKTPSL
ncbi:bile acid:sodium symporter family protein [Alkalihalobacillus sp. MEB130]|uniref:bile acid:sodium symporter family protein n=1 Tax=Alkalihalobacillus sp. MEB130 TaxID=2976704 RepID=UPI0028DF0B20|nr:bile acid:sodium symporter family protein [Alkalihalobacillus sp. MEB130]MDT8862171.1 bile acid:sodium symporter family protein [Alkalihalobacillus sp. MEB130]